MKVTWYESFLLVTISCAAAGRESWYLWNQSKLCVKIPFGSTLYPYKIYEEKSCLYAGQELDFAGVFVHLYKTKHSHDLNKWIRGLCSRSRETLLVIVLFQSICCCCIIRCVIIEIIPLHVFLNTKTEYSVSLRNL